MFVKNYVSFSAWLLVIIGLSGILSFKEDGVLIGLFCIAYAAWLFVENKNGKE